MEKAEKLGLEGQLEEIAQPGGKHLCKRINQKEKKGISFPRSSNHLVHLVEATEPGCDFCFFCLVVL